MSLRVDYQELKESLKEALIKEKHSISNSSVDISVFAENLDFNELNVDIELRSISKPPVEAYELVPPPRTLEAADMNIQLHIAIKVELPQCTSNKILLDVTGNIHKPIYNIAAIQSKIDIEAVQFECLMNVALVNGHVVVWGSDFVLEPSFSISSTDAFLSKYLIESAKKFLTTHFSRMQHIF